MFKGIDIRPFPNKVQLASSAMHGEELKYVTEAYEKTRGVQLARINEVEKVVESVVIKYSVGL